MPALTREVAPGRDVGLAVLVRAPADRLTLFRQRAGVKKPTLIAVYRPGAGSGSGTGVGTGSGVGETVDVAVSVAVGVACGVAAGGGGVPAGVAIGVAVGVGVDVASGAAARVGDGVTPGADVPAGVGAVSVAATGVANAVANAVVVGASVGVARMSCSGGDSELPVQPSTTTIAERSSATPALAVGAAIRIELRCVALLVAPLLAQEALELVDHVLRVGQLGLGPRRPPRRRAAPRCGGRSRPSPGSWRSRSSPARRTAPRRPRGRAG